MSYLKQAWLVLMLAIAFGGALAGIQIGLGPIIEENKRNETYNQVPKLVAGAVKDKTQEQEIGGRKVLKAIDETGRHVGWVLPAKGMGFADVIEVLIGLSADASRITGLYVLDQKETPGLGNKITFSGGTKDAPLFLDNFVDRSAAEPLEVVKTRADYDRNEVQAITGATVSSVAVTGIVNKAVTEFRSALKPSAKGDQAGPYGDVAAVVPGASDSRAVKLEVAGYTVYQAYAARSDAGWAHAGWAVRVTTKGREETMVALVGLDPQARKITGLRVLQHGDTPGYGEKIARPDFTQQFAGQPTDGHLELTGSDASTGEIVPASGATSSSRKLTDTVNKAMDAVRDELARLAKEAETNGQ